MGPLTSTPRFIDGGLATTLQRVGLPTFTPVDAWLLGRPHEVQRVHAAFVEAGAEILVTGTFRALPALQPHWRAVLANALKVAEAAAKEGVEIWGSIGPGAPPGELARALAPYVDGLLLETFTIPEEARIALAACLHLGVPVVVLLSVAEDGCLFDGREVGPHLHDLLSDGAAAVGLGCSAPEAIARVLEGWTGPPVWARPGHVGESPELWLEHALALAPRCAVLGGCCGVDPHLLGQLVAGARPRP